jgi:hypothetical protein
LFRYDEPTQGCWKTGTWVNPPHDEAFLLGIGLDEETATYVAPLISAVNPTAQIEMCQIRHYCFIPKSSGNAIQSTLLMFGLSLVLAQF